MLVLSFVASTSAGYAAERVWDGGARGNGWNDIGNWAGIGVPVAGDSLRFPAGALKPSNNNDYPAGTSFNVLTYAGAGYTASGNEIGLTGGIVVSHGAGNTVLNLPINVALNQTILVSVAGANLFLNGTVEMAGSRTILTFDGAGQTVVVGNISDGRVIVGGGTIRKNGSGTLYVLQNLTFGGSTVVNGGTLIMDGRMSNSAVTVNASATLRGTGKVGGLTANSGGAVSPGLNSPAILDSLGDVALNAGSTFNVRLNGTSVGLNYDQLRVQGTVTLGGTLNVTAGFVAAIGDTFTIIENDGTDDVVGTFARLPERAILMVNGRPFQISYGARGLGGFGRDVNDVTLEAVPALAVWDGGGGQNNLWSTPQNWVGDTLPLPGDDIQFYNTSNATLVTVNDFPDGRLFGSILLGRASHRVEGNLAEFDGRIETIDAGIFDIYVPMRLRGGMLHAIPFGNVNLRGPITLTANQTFRLNHANAYLTVYGSIALDGHDLTVDTVARPQFRGFIGTPGRMVKRGANELVLWGTNNCATTVNEGTFTIENSGLVVGPLVVNTGAVLLARGVFYDLEVLNGGVFAPRFPTANGSVRMLGGSTLDIDLFSVFSGGTTIATNTGFFVPNGGQVEISGCSLNLNNNLGMATEAFRFVIINQEYDVPPVTGTFNGLPEGGILVANGRAFSITYKGTAGFSTAQNDVILYSDPTFVWDGGGADNNWSTPENWVFDIAPVSGSKLVFPANVTKRTVTNDLPANTLFPAISFDGDNYLVYGNQVTTEGIHCSHSSGETVIFADVQGVGPGGGDVFNLSVAGAGRLLMEGSVSGHVWNKTGTGTLRFGGVGANSLFTGEAEEGELELAKPPGVNTITFWLHVGRESGATNATVRLSEDHQIADTATIRVNSPAELELNGNLETIGKLLGDGTVALSERLQRGGRLTVKEGYFSGKIIGGGGLTKTGPALLTLSNANTFTGMTIIDAGELRVEGTQANSPVRLDGGVLSGRGWLGTITGNLGGTVVPGFGGAALEVALHSRDVAFNSTTTFRPTLTSSSPDFENHKLQVSGSVNLGGCALSVDLLGTFKPTNGASFVIIDNDAADPVVGTFGGLPEGAVFGGDGLPFRVSYTGGTGNDVVLTRVATPPSRLSSIAKLGNGQVRIEGMGIGGVVYPIQAASNLNPIILWTPVGSATGNASGLFQFIDPGASNRPMRFYRAISP